ncbi:MAG: alpha/beta hydrolase [Pseudomonadota bacterium]|nr:alpha/beta hydrolase [Pseudomonadota bacterium]
METWHDLDRAALDRAYNARDSVADFEAELQRWTNLSSVARFQLDPVLDIVYDAPSGMALDWFTGADGGPVVLWIHGGYWRAVAKSEQSLVAPGLVAAGAHVAVMDYSLAPGVTLDEILRQARAAAAFVLATAATHGADPARIFIAGHSAGAQLGGMLLSEFGALRGGILLSGLFELEPIRLTHINDWLHLDPDAVSRLSPMRHIPDSGPALLVGYGGRESDEFRWQSETYAAAWQAAGHRAALAPQPARHHFDIVVALGDPADPLCRAAAAFIQTE